MARPGPRKQRCGVIGHSAQGRTIRVQLAGDPRAALRVLVVGGQHGDEPLARIAVEQFHDRMRRIGRDAELQLATISDANPDGAAARTRASAQGVDLNRDHLLLRSPELQALHRFVREWRPHLIIDVHTYPPRRKNLLQRGLEHCHDVFLDVPTNPAIRLSMTSAEMLHETDRVAKMLATDGAVAGRYLLVRRSGRIRHSTPDIVDARNLFALRYGIPTVLIEGRQVPIDAPDSSRLNHVLRAMTDAIGMTAAWSYKRHRQLTIRPKNCAAGTRVPIRCRYRRSDDAARLLMKDRSTGDLRKVSIPGRYSPEVAPTTVVPLPIAYAVDRNCVEVIAILTRHGFQSYLESPASISATRFQAVRVKPSGRDGRPPRHLELSKEVAKIPRSGHLFYPVDQQGGHALAVLLEPDSKYGLARFKTCGLELCSGQYYPVLRCEGTDARHSQTTTGPRLAG